ncbi:MAG TPA: zinc-binding dehydrogenase [bacterium]|nr:zinc-binding dehydrogenase [bacterium]
MTLVPDGLDPAEAVSLILSYVTMLQRIAQVKKGQRILVHGAGGAVGTAVLQLAKLFDLLAQSKIKPVIAAPMPLAEVRRAHELSETAGAQGKIVLTI